VICQSLFNIDFNTIAFTIAMKTIAAARASSRGLSLKSIFVPVPEDPIAR
jgi:hypothetical protein